MFWHSVNFLLSFVAGAQCEWEEFPQKHFGVVLCVKKNLAEHWSEQKQFHAKTLWSQSAKYCISNQSFWHTFRVQIAFYKSELFCTVNHRSLVYVKNMHCLENDTKCLQNVVSWMVYTKNVWENRQIEKGSCPGSWRPDLGECLSQKKHFDSGS